jgi:protein-S-isoprenylcysteine O-methyltransferase Ste14
MPNLTTSLEIDLRWLAAVAGLGTLAYAIYNMVLAQARPSGYQSGSARKVLRTRYLLVATLVFILVGFILWKPLPIQLPLGVQLIVSILGALIYFASLVLYLWGLRNLGENFNASCGFALRLNQAHRLVTKGPYAYIRHPMYLAVILVGWGGLLLFRTWAMLVFALFMFGLIVRARREEAALARVFGRQWDAYKRHVPGWIPHLENLLGKKRYN